MNRHQAMIYVICTSDPIWPHGGYKIDVRLASLVASIHQLGRTYDEVTWSEMWASRAQLGMLVGREIPEVAFEAEVPCGKTGHPKRADADDFCDERWWPNRAQAEEAYRKVKLMVMSYPDATPRQHAEQGRIPFLVDDS